MTERIMASVSATLALAALALGCGGNDNGGDDGGGPDAAACTTPTEATCEGNVVVHCVGGELQSDDCTTTLATCTPGAGGATCVDACAAAGVTETATCSGDAIVRCDTVGGRHVVVSTACDLGDMCTQPSGGAATCAGDPCSDVGPLGRCDGDTLVRCSGGAPASTDCAATSQVCGYSGDATGYACVRASAAFVVTGTVRYEDRPPETSGALGAIRPVEARSAEVAVVLDAGSTVLATALTSDDGSYTLRYTATAGAMVHIMVTARSTTALRPVRVNRTQNAVHAFGGTSFAAAATATQDVLVTDASGVSEAFNVLDMGVYAFDVVRDEMGATPVQLTARWSRGSNQGTYYSNGAIFLLGAASDDDGYDDTVILHEIGHFVEDRFGRTDSPGGSHDGSPTDPNLAWSEGCSTYFAMAVRNRPHYMDSNSGGGWGYDADTTVTALTGSPTLGSDISEDTVSEVLWDIADGGAGDDDPMTSSNHTAVLRIWPDYLASATLRTVGESGVDLVDFLDGWFIEQGLTSCSGVRAVLLSRAFPYDFGSSAGPCP
jgi:hypothetical protein